MSDLERLQRGVFADAGGRYVRVTEAAAMRIGTTDGRYE